MPTITSCNLAPLTVYYPTNTDPWNKQKINHLYRRLGFGASPQMIQDALIQTPSQVVDHLIDEALNTAPNGTPDWGYWVKDDFDNAGRDIFRYKQDLKNQMVEDLFTNNLRDRLTLFWSNHFVTEDSAISSPAYVYQYYNLLQLHAIGNFKDFTRDIGLSAAMLVYLNGDENTKNRPNENYGRELYELFTLGVDNGYTQDDIIETSRALTGWNETEQRWGPILFKAENFDEGEKTIFGRSGNWGYEDVIDILFEQRASQIANFICTKLYRYFVSPNINEEIINQMSQIFLENNFEIAPVLRALFKSQHFYDINSLGVIIKSPSDLQISLFKELNFELPADFDFYIKIRTGNSELGQNLLNPIDVAGWPGDRNWISSITLTSRWERINWYLWRAWRHNEEQFRNIAKEIMDGNSSDVTLVSKSLVDFFLCRELVNDNEYAQALEIFKNEVPETYFEDGTWNLDWSSTPRQVYELLKYIITIPEFQLK